MKVEGYFSGIKNAREAVERLKQYGYGKSFVDLNEHFSMDNNTEINLAGSYHGSSLSDLVLHSGSPSGLSDQSPLAAASPMVSGMGGFSEIADINYKIVAEVNDGDENRVKAIIRNMGGEINNPNLNIHERIEDIPLENVDIPNEIL